MRFEVSDFIGLVRRVRQPWSASCRMIEIFKLVAAALPIVG